MASWTDPAALLLSVGLTVGCGSKTADSGSIDSGNPASTCETQPWSWDNTGAPFMRTWCTSCHHSDLDAEARQGAPEGVNLESWSDVQTWAERVEARVWADSAPMPPAGGPTEAELEILAEWLACGAPE